MLREGKRRGGGEQTNSQSAGHLLLQFGVWQGVFRSTPSMLDTPTHPHEHPPVSGSSPLSVAPLLWVIPGWDHHGKRAKGEENLKRGPYDVGRLAKLSSEATRKASLETLRKEIV